MSITTMIKIGADTSGATQNLKKLEQNLEKMKNLKDKAKESGKDGTLSKQEEKELKKLGESFDSTYGTYISNLKTQAKALKEEMRRVQTEAHNTSNVQLKASYDAYKKRMEQEKSRIETEIKNVTGMNKAKTTYSEPQQPEEPAKKKFTDSAEFKGFLKNLAAGNGKGALQGGLGMFGNLMGGKLGAIMAPLMKLTAGLGAIVGVYKLMGKGAEASNRRDASAVEVWNSSGIYGNDFQKASKDAASMGAPYNYKGDKILEIQKTFSDIKGTSNPEEMKKDVLATTKAARALGIDPNELAYNTANMSKQTNMKVPEITQLVTNVTETLGATGREEEVTEKLQKLIDIGLENNVILSKEQVESYAKMAKVLQDKGYDAGKSMDLAGSLTDKLSGSKSLESFVMSNANEFGLEGSNGQETMSNVRRALQSKDPAQIAKFLGRMVEGMGGEANVRSMLTGGEGWTEQQVDDAFDISKNMPNQELTQSNKIALGADNYSKSVTGKNDAVGTSWDNLKQKGSRGVAKLKSLFDPAVSGAGDIFTGNETNKPIFNPETEMQTQAGSLGSTLSNAIQSTTSPSPYTPGNLRQANPSDMDSDMLNQIINNLVEKYEKKSGVKSKLRGQGQAFMDASASSGMNVMDLLSIAMNESAGGTSNIAQKKNNFFGYNAIDSNPFYGANGYDTPYTGIMDVANKIGKNYMDKRGQVTMEQIGHGYNFMGQPTGYKYARDDRWHDTNEKHGKEIYKQYLEVRVTGDLTGITPEQFDNFTTKTAEYLKMNKFNK